MMAEAAPPPAKSRDDRYDGMADAIQNLKCRRVLKEHTMPIISFDFCEQGTLALTSSEDDTLVIYDVLQAKKKQIVMGKKYGFGITKFTHKSTCVLHAATKMDRAIRYLSLHDNRYLQAFVGHEQPVVALAMHPLRDTFLSGSIDDKICLWDFLTAHCEAMMQIANVPSIAFDPTGATFAVAFDNRQIRIYDVRHFQRGPIHTWDVLKGDVVLQAMLGRGATADGFGLATSIRKGMTWLQLQYSEDGQWLFIGTGTWRYHYIMNVRTGELSESISGHAELLASPNMRRFYGRGLAPLGNRLICPGGFVPTLQASASPTPPLLNRTPIVMAGDATGRMHFFEGDTARQIKTYEILPAINASASMDDSSAQHLVSWLQWNPKYRVLAAVTGKHLSFWQP